MGASESLSSSSLVLLSIPLSLVNELLQAPAMMYKLTVSGWRLPIGVSCLGMELYVAKAAFKTTGSRNSPASVSTVVENTGSFAQSLSLSFRDKVLLYSLG